MKKYQIFFGIANFLMLIVVLCASLILLFFTIGNNYLPFDSLIQNLVNQIGK